MSALPSSPPILACNYCLYTRLLLLSLSTLGAAVSTLSVFPSKGPPFLLSLSSILGAAVSTLSLFPS